MLRRFPGEARGSCVQSDHCAIAVGQYQKIATGQLPHVFRCVLNRGWIMSRHDGARDGKVGHQFRRARQHDFAIMLKILECRDRVSQFLHDSLPHMALHAVPYHQKAHRREPRCD